MATVTGGGATNVLNVGSNDTNGIATTLAATLSTALQNGSLTRVGPNNNPPTGGGLTAILTGGTYTLAPAVTALVVGDNASSIITGSGAANESVLIGASTVYFNTNGGSGVLVSGDLPQVIATPTVGGGSFTFTTGTGNDIIVAQSGFNTVNAGGGTNAIFTGNALDVINSQGNDVINGVGGRAGLTDTVNGGGAGTTTFIGEGAKNLVYNGGAGSTTILGGSGSDTINLASGGDLVQGGSAGNNQISTGFTGNSVIFAGGNGDVLTANGMGTNVLVAAGGNETLTGAGATGSNIFYTGSGRDLITGGSGNDTIFAGSGSSTIDGGAGADLIAISASRAGGTVILNGFRPGTDNDRITLQGYGSNEVANDLSRAVVTQPSGSTVGSTTITLSDNTRITFNGVTNLNSSNFV